MPRWKLPATLFASAILLACNGQEDTQPEEVHGEAMGTTWSVKLGDGIASHDARRLKSEIAAAIEAVEQSMSTYREDSELSMFNDYRERDWFPVSAGFCRVVEASLELSALSGGALDVTIGPAVDRWGFGPGEIVTDLPSAEELSALRVTTGYDHLQADCLQPALRKSQPHLSVDLSAIAKGYAVDIVAEWLDATGLNNYLVEIGGELRAAGQHPAGRPWSVGIEDFERADGSATLALRLTDLAVATSGGYRNYFEHEGIRYSHTIDPRTGAPVTHDLASVTVAGDTAMVADAWATALLVLGPQDGMALAKKHGLAACFQVLNEGNAELLMTPAFEQLLAVE